MIYFFFTWVLLCLYSFTRQDLNLTFIPKLPAWFQQLGFFHRPVASLIFLVLVLVFCFIYLKLIRQQLPDKHSWLKWAIPLTLLGIIAYPMFSYDLFNYLFNAKMVLIYKANPHLTTAINFPKDPMLRFMHNIHTPAPYAYGWTATSLIPGLAWLTQKFTLSFWAMKAFIAVFWLGELWILKQLVRKLFPNQPWRWWLFALSPLVLIETLINGHNDVVMMFLALLAYWFLLNSHQLKSILFLLLSASIKYATIILLPVYLLKQKFKQLDIPSLAAVLLLAILFTRPGQMHSWYLIWAFSFAVLSKSTALIKIFTALTLGAVLRYLPYIYFGNWDPPVDLYRQLIWLGSVFLAPYLLK